MREKEQLRGEKMTHQTGEFGDGVGEDTGRQAQRNSRDKDRNRGGVRGEVRIKKENTV